MAGPVRVPVINPRWRWLLLQVDGALGARATGLAGVGLVVRTLHGRVIFWHCQQAPARTGNEAEYQAVMAGLEVMRQRFPGIGVRCLTDSQVVVRQLLGQAAVRAEALKPLYAAARALMGELHAVELHLIPRTLNRLADTLAWEALHRQRVAAHRNQES